MLLVEDGRRVARFGLLPGRMRLGAELIAVNWGSEFDYDGDPAHRPYAGLLFLRALERAGSYCGAGPSGLFEPLLRAAGLQLIAVPRYAALLRSGPFLRRAAGHLPDPLGWASDLALAAERRLRRIGTRGVEVVAVGRFDERIRQLERARGTCSPYRDDVELNWVLSRPWLTGGYQYWPYVTMDRGDLVGFVLVRTKRADDHVVASVMRMAVADRRQDLAQGALAALLRTHADADVLDVHTNEPHIAAAARALGLRRRGALQVTARLTSAADEARRSAGCELATMPLQYGEGDVIFA